MRSRAPRLWSSGIWSARGSDRLDARGPTDLHCLAELCDGAAEPSREIDELIALAIAPSLRLLENAGPAAWLRPDGARVSAPRYSSSTADALTLVSDGYRIEYNPRAGGRIEIYGPDDEAGWGRNRYFPLAASAAALRLRASLESRRSAKSDANGQSIRTGARPIGAPERSLQTG